MRERLVNCPPLVVYRQENLNYSNQSLGTPFAYFNDWVEVVNLRRTRNILARQYPKGFCLALFTLFQLNTPIAHANLEQAYEAIERAKGKLTERFVEFLGGKNVEGQAMTPDGKPAGQAKQNKDNKANFQADTTYHADSVTSENNTTEIALDNPRAGGAGGARTRSAGATPPTGGADDGEDKFDQKVPENVSRHGKETEAGGSSRLERTAWDEHETKSRDQEQQRRAGEDRGEDAEEGIKQESFFEEETIQVKRKDDAGGGAGAAGGGDDEEIKVSRTTIQEDSNEKFKEVGSDSFESIQQDARDEGFKEDDQTMGNPLLYIMAAQRAQKAIYRNAMARQAQRRVKDVDAIAGRKMILNEGTPTPEAWAEQQLAIAQAEMENDPNMTADQRQRRMQQLQQEFQQAVQDGNKLVGLAPNEMIGPKLEVPDRGTGGGGAGGGGPPQKEVVSDPQNEDGLDRDNRMQQLTMLEGGKKASELESNWQQRYGQDDDTAEVQLSPGNIVNLSVADQYDNYNGQIDAAKEGQAEVNERLREEMRVDPESFDQFKLATDGSVPVWQATKIPDATYTDPEEFGLGQVPDANADIPQNYLEMVNQ